MKIFVYDTNPGITGWKKFFEWCDGMRYMALAGGEYPWGRIVGYGRASEKAHQAAIRKLIKERDLKRPERELVSTEEVEI